jgi:hypothetical protein
MRSRCETTIYFESKNSQPVIVDVGSNIGLAILFFKRLYPSSTVIGFEPDPGAFEVLKRNIADDRLRGVQVLNGAVHGKRERVYLYGDRSMPGSPQLSTRAVRLWPSARGRGSTARWGRAPATSRTSSFTPTGRMCGPRLPLVGSRRGPVWMSATDLTLEIADPIEPLAESWDELASRSSFGPRRLHIVVVCRGGRLVGLAPLEWLGSTLRAPTNAAHARVRPARGRRRGNTCLGGEAVRGRRVHGHARASRPRRPKSGSPSSRPREPLATVPSSGPSHARPTSAVAAASPSTSARLAATCATTPSAAYAASARRARQAAMSIPGRAARAVIRRRRAGGRRQPDSRRLD